MISLRTDNGQVHERRAGTARQWRALFYVFDGAAVSDIL